MTTQGDGGVGGAPFEVRTGAATDVGRRRDHNEDSYLCEAPVFLVADGMGGYAAGEVASSRVIEAFYPLIGKPLVRIEEMRLAYSGAVRAVASLPSKRGAGPGSTLSGVGIASSGGVGYWLVMNVGDSRTYRFNQGALEQISVDHSVVQEMVEAGELTSDEAISDRRRNVVTRAIGAGGASEPDFWMIPVRNGDRILVCSDGLSLELSDTRMARMLAQNGDPQEAAGLLVKAACDAGGRDNVTAVVVDVLRVNSPTIDIDTIPRRTSLSGGRG